MNMDNNVLCFVYGTLKRNYKNHKYYASGMQFVATDTIRGELYKLGYAYPFILTGNNSIPGEVFSINQDTFDRIRNMELNAGYMDKIVRTAGGRECHVFFGKPSSFAVYIKPENKIAEWIENIPEQQQAVL